MNILGLGGSLHDLSACLVSEDGTVKIAIEDERLNRKKHSDGLDPKLLLSCLAADYCLKEAGIADKDLDLIVGNDILPFEYYARKVSERGNVRLINHHLAHAASAFYPSNFEEAAVLVVDGSGSVADSVMMTNETTTFYSGKGSELVELRKDAGKVAGLLPYPRIQSSVGGFYTTFTETIGFKRFEEGKTMGLAPYGTDRFVEDFFAFYRLDEAGRFVCTEEHARRRVLFELRNLKQKRSLSEEERFQTRADIAYALQFHLERVMVEFCRYLHQATGSKNLCLAGGVALNSVANYAILERTPFENLFVQPAAADNGTSIGSALYGYHHLLNQPRDAGKQPLFSPYLGKAYEDGEVRKALEERRGELIVTKPDDIGRETARLLSEGAIVGWFQGRSEIGPRALGNRSILADPRRADMKDVINRRIKHREPFRPFAPIVLEEYQEQFFRMKHPSHYMLLVPGIHEHRRQQIPAVTHVDGTGRVQTVASSLNPKLHRLVSSFRELTGVPVLLNTSFNDNGQPIVESPADAVSCFLSIDLDYLVMHDYLVRKSGERP